VTALLLRRTEVAELLTLDECIAAVEEGFRLRGLGRLPPSAILGVPVPGGGFHVKAALLPGPRSYFAAKVNGNFPDNPRRSGLPSIQGLIVLCDGENGRPLAVMDSIEITILRTGAATAVAAKYLARPASRVATICGCGNQGRVQLRAIARVLQLERVFAFDADEHRARELADELSAELRLSVAAVTDLAQAVSRSDVCVTCTPSRAPLVGHEDVRPGTFIAAVGADSPEKQELEPAILASAKVVVDVLEQCASIGELHHALNAGLMQRADVHAELAEVVSGSKPGRTSDQEVVIFDSTGTALQDVAAAVAVHEKAVRLGKGAAIDFAL
jgi:alanine dehydrogenase